MDLTTDVVTGKVGKDFTSGSGARHGVRTSGGQV